MSVSYKKLWKLLIDKDMKKKDLEKAAGISNYDAVVLMGLPVSYQKIRLCWHRIMRWA